MNWGRIPKAGWFRIAQWLANCLAGLSWFGFKAFYGWLPCPIAQRKLARLDWWLVQGLSKVCHHGPWSHKGVVSFIRPTRCFHKKSLERWASICDHTPNIFQHRSHLCFNSHWVSLKHFELPILITCSFSLSLPTKPTLTLFSEKCKFSEEIKTNGWTSNFPFTLSLVFQTKRKTQIRNC